MSQEIIKPFFHAALRLLALTPPALRSNLLTRVCGRLVSFSNLEGEITTNLGLNSRFRVDYAEARHPTLVFGRPIDHLAERGALLLTQALVEKSGAYLDIGANYGYFTYVARNASKTIPIYFFEPNPELFSFIEETTSRNKLTNIVGIKKAIGKENKRTAFFVNLIDSALSSLHGEGFSKGDRRLIEVDVITLESFLKENPKLNNLLVKVDVENAEFDFVEGAASTFGRIDFLILEVLEQAVNRDIISKVMGLGKFQAYYINDLTLIPAPQGKFEYSSGQFNWLFCRQSPDELSETLRHTALQVRK